MDGDHGKIEKVPSILIVDDDPSSLKVLNQILSPDYDILLAKSGEEAVELAVSERPDLILLDVIMGDMSGYDVLKQLKSIQETSITPIIFITGLSSAEDEEKGLVLGASDYIAKPFLDVVVRARVNTQINNVRQRREIEYLSMTDALTGIPNRRSFDMRLSVEWAHAIREKTPIAVLLIDVDNLKKYNDTYKHMQGDIMLKTVAGILASAVRRAQDIAARIGGDEFAVLLPNTDMEAALEIAESLRGSVEAAAIMTSDKKKTSITISIGAACSKPSPGDLSDSLISLADSRLYQAKSDGRNKVCP